MISMITDVHCCFCDRYPKCRFLCQDVRAGLRFKVVLGCPVLFHNTPTPVIWHKKVCCLLYFLSVNTKHKKVKVFYWLHGQRFLSCGWYRMVINSSYYDWSNLLAIRKHEYRHQWSVSGGIHTVFLGIWLLYLVFSFSIRRFICCLVRICYDVKSSSFHIPL